MTTKPTFSLTLRVERDDHLDPQGYLRLRRALKVLLRAFGLRCVAYSEDKPEGKTTEGKCDA